MSATLHLAPIGHDKTALTTSCIRQLRPTRDNAMPTVWVLLATRRQELQFRQRLIEDQAGPPAIFNIEFFNFYALNARLLKLAGTPVRRLSGLMRHKILRQILLNMLEEGQLNTFHRIAETRGLVSVVAELINELKQNSIDDVDFANAAGSAKDKEIAAIYRRYQETLRQSELADVEGEGWLALATVRKRQDIAANVDLLIVDGYDQFTPVQAALLAELSRNIDAAHITLTILPDEISHASPSRSALARKGLFAAYDSAGVNLDVCEIEHVPDTRHQSLDRLGQGIFREFPAQSCGDAIQLIETPDPAEETRAVLRKVKRLLVDCTPADSILIALRDWERYATYFESGRDEYALPLLLHYDRSHGRAPVIAALIDLLELAPRYRRRHLLDVLRSPYFSTGLNDNLLDLLDRVSLERQFLGGVEDDWLELLLLAERDNQREDADETLTSLTADQALALSTALSALFSIIRPPERAKLPAFVQWIVMLLGADPVAELVADNQAFSLNIIKNAWEHDRANPAIVSRDLSALNGLKTILRDMLASEDVLETAMGSGAPATWQTFWSDLKYSLETSADNSINQSRKDQVLVTTAAEARGLPHDHVFILGLAEGIFPAEAGEDPLYLDSERQDFQTRGIPLATRAHRTDDRGLFYELISLPRKSLTLSRPMYDGGRSWIESYFWRAVRAVFPDAPIQTSPVGAVVNPDEAASSSELMLAVAAKLGNQDAIDAEVALRARNWLLSQPDHAKLWRRLQHGRAVEIGRLSNVPFDQHSGILQREVTRHAAARHLGEHQIFSASRLKDYGLCGFRYFAKRLLKLEETREPEAGVDALQLGLLNHSILEKTYEKIAARGLGIHENNLPTALSIFYDVANGVLATAPTDFNFHATATWEYEKHIIVNRLAALVRLDFSANSPLNRFGESRRVHQLEYAFSDVPIQLPDGMAPLRVRGFVDRIDDIDGSFVVVDYKTGGTTINRSEMESGRDFQMLIYLEAMQRKADEQVDNRPVQGGMFWHLRDLKTSGVLSTDDSDDLAALELAKSHIAANLRMGRAGQFPVHAIKLESGKCSRYCEFSRLCRIHVTDSYKSLPEPTTS